MHGSLGQNGSIWKYCMSIAIWHSCMSYSVYIFKQHCTDSNFHQIQYYEKILSRSCLLQKPRLNPSPPPTRPRCGWFNFDFLKVQIITRPYWRPHFPDTRQYINMTGHLPYLDVKVSRFATWVRTCGRWRPVLKALRPPLIIKQLVGSFGVWAISPQYMDVALAPQPSKAYAFGGGFHCFLHACSMICLRECMTNSFNIICHGWDKSI